MKIRNRILGSLFAIMSIVAFITALAIPVAAQTVTPSLYQVLPGGTNNVVALSTNDYSSTLPSTYFSRSRYITVSVAALFGNGTSTNSENVVFTFDQSADNVHWFTNALSLSLPLKSTNVCTLNTNLDIGANPWFRLHYISNTDGQDNITNVFVYAVGKQGI